MGVPVILSFCYSPLPAGAVGLVVGVSGWIGGWWLLGAGERLELEKDGVRTTLVS